jgi:hypothetical protein
VARGSARIRRALSVTRVAISLFLVAATALASRALPRATAIETGYRGERLGFATLDAGVGRLTPERAAAAYQTALAALAALPEVQGASLLAALPLDPGTDVASFAVAGYTPAPDERMATEVNYLGPRALSLLGVDLLSGREIDARDTAAAEPVAVVSRRFAERYFGGRDPLGDAVRLSTVSVREVGVAEDVHAHGPGEVQPPALYLPLFQARGSVLLRPVSIVDRARRVPGALLATVTRALAATAPGVPVEPVGRYDDLLAAALAPQRVASGLFGAFSIVATLPAATGLFGLVAHAAAARSRELGLRAALGAAPPPCARSSRGSTATSRSSK